MTSVNLHRSQTNTLFPSPRPLPRLSYLLQLLENTQETQDGWEGQSAFGWCDLCSGERQHENNIKDGRQVSRL